MSIVTGALPFVNPLYQLLSLKNFACPWDDTIVVLDLLVAIVGVILTAMALWLEWQDRK